MANRTQGAEDMFRPFRRRHKAGQRVNRTGMKGTRKANTPVTRDFDRCRTLIECSIVARSKYGIGAGLLKVILDSDLRNSVKLMRISELCNEALVRRRIRRSQVVATKLYTGGLVRAQDAVVPAPRPREARRRRDLDA